MALIEFLNVVKSWQVVVASIVGLLAIYKFYFKQPNIHVEVWTSELDSEDNTPMVVLMQNNGRKFAEDVVVRLEYNWYPDFGREEVMNLLFNSNLDYKKTEDPSELLSAAQDQNPDTYSVNYFVDNAIPVRVELPLDSFLIKLERDKRYEIEYITACRSYGPYRSKIIIETDEDGNIETQYDHPKIYHRFIHWLPGI